MANIITDHIDIWTSAQTQKTNGTGRGNHTANHSLHGIKELRELILELAVRGKLVPQEPNDEPASVLLEKIAKEKLRLIKEGKIKKQEPSPEITDEEKPFKLPRGWEWVRLGNLVSIQTGKKDVNEGNDNGIYPFFSCAAASLKSDNYSFDCEALILPGNGANVGLVTYFNGKFEAYQRTYVLNDFMKIFPKYIEKSLNAGFLKSLEGKQYGSAINYIKIGNLLNFIFALPPLAEQHRIVAKVDELMAICDQLEQQQTESNAAHQTLVETLLTTLTSAANQDEFIEVWQCIANHFDILFTTEQSIDQLKQTILQLAVMGKLVSQDPNDEPANVLLEKIAAERAHLVKDGKIKKQESLSEIKDDEKPYDLPQGWEWSRLQQIIQISSGDGLTAANMNKEGEVPVYGGNGVTGYHDQANVTKQTLVIGRVGFYCGSIHITPASAWVTDNAFITTFSENNIFINYLFWLLKGTNLKENENATAQPVISGRKVYPIVIGLPPTAEQHRIVAKVDELMAVCDTLKARIKDAQTTQIHLADAIVEQAVS